MSTNKGRPILLGERKTTVNGKPVCYWLKRSLRAKTVRLQVLPGSGLTVTIPRYYDPGDVPKTIQKYASWILNKLATCAVRHDHRLEPVPGDNIPYLGRAVPLLVNQGPDKLYSFRLDPHGLVISLGSGSVKLSVLLEHWYRREASRIIKRKLDELSARLGLRYNRLFLRGQRTRWASCSAKGNLSFNWKLILTPEPVIEYVVIHELAHLQHLNHSERFWDLVARHCPGWRDHKKWLRQHASVADWPFVRALEPPSGFPPAATPGGAGFRAGAGLADSQGPVSQHLAVEAGNGGFGLRF